MDGKRQKALVQFKKMGVGGRGYGGRLILKLMVLEEPVLSLLEVDTFLSCYPQ